MSAMVRVAERLPLAEGLKTTVMVHFPAAAIAVPQVFVWVKSLELAPVTVTLARLKLALPVFESVTAWDVLLPTV